MKVFFFQSDILSGTNRAQEYLNVCFPTYLVVSIFKWQTYWTMTAPEMGVVQPGGWDSDIDFRGDGQQGSFRCLYFHCRMVCSSGHLVIQLHVFWFPFLLRWEGRNIQTLEAVNGSLGLEHLKVLHFKKTLLPPYLYTQRGASSPDPWFKGESSVESITYL